MKAPPGTFGLKIASGTQLLLERPGGVSYPIHPLWLRERCRDAQARRDATTGADPGSPPKRLTGATTSQRPQSARHPRNQLAMQLNVIRADDELTDCS
jgi:hypothetical protein